MACTYCYIYCCCCRRTNKTRTHFDTIRVWQLNEATYSPRVDVITAEILNCIFISDSIRFLFTQRTHPPQCMYDTYLNQRGVARVHGKSDIFSHKSGMVYNKITWSTFVDGGF